MRSTIVELAADRVEAAAADVVGRAALACDQLPALQPLEDAERAFAQPAALAGNAVDLRDLARRRAAPVNDASTLRPSARSISTTPSVTRKWTWTKASARAATASAATATAAIAGRSSTRTAKR
jgi:hypothetical protein